jgi:flagellar biosynthesis protein FlhG
MDQAQGLRLIKQDRPAAPGYRTANGAEPGGPPRSGRNPLVLAISSGKGGVGKTNVVANLGLALARRGKRILVLDADLGLANIDILLGLTPRFTLEHFLAGHKKLQDILLPGPEGLLILPAGSGVPELVDLDETQKICLLNEMDQLSQHIDWLLIDTGAGISTNVLYFNLAAQESIILVTPEPTSITDAYALIKILATRHQKKNFLILINAAAEEGEAKEVFRKISLVADRFLSSVSLDYLGFIPFDKHIPLAVKKQQALLELFPHSPAGKSFTDLSRLLTDRPFRNRNEGNVQFFWKQVWQVSNINVSA